MIGPDSPHYSVSAVTGRLRAACAGRFYASALVTRRLRRACRLRDLCLKLTRSVTKANRLRDRKTPKEE